MPNLTQIELIEEAKRFCEINIITQTFAGKSVSRLLLELFTPTIDEQELARHGKCLANCPKDKNNPSEFKKTAWSFTSTNQLNFAL